VYESYVPQKEFREKRSLIRLHASLIRMKSEMKNKIHSILEKCDYKHDFSDLFGKAGTEWLRSIEISTIDRLSIDSYLNAIYSLDEQLDNIERTMAQYSFQSEDVKMLMSITGIDFFSALVISSEIVDIKRFQTPWKLVSYAGLNPTSRDSSEVMRRGHITKQGSRWLRWILYECAQQTITAFEESIPPLVDLRCSNVVLAADFSKRNVRRESFHDDLRLILGSPPLPTWHGRLPLLVQPSKVSLEKALKLSSSGGVRFN